MYFSTFHRILLNCFALHRIFIALHWIVFYSNTLHSLYFIALHCTDLSSETFVALHSIALYIIVLHCTAYPKWNKALSLRYTIALSPWQAFELNTDCSNIFKIAFISELQIKIQLLEYAIPTPAAAATAVSPKSPRCYGVSLCYGVNRCYGVNLCYGVSPCYGVNPCYGVSLCYGVNLCYGVSHVMVLAMLWC